MIGRLIGSAVMVLVVWGFVYGFQAPHGGQWISLLIASVLGAMFARLLKATRDDT